MRILVANDGFGDGGGVQSYLDAVLRGLIDRSHDVAFLHYDAEPAGCAPPSLPTLPHTSVEACGLDRAIATAQQWGTDVVFSHNMSRLEVERRLIDTFPVVKFMHGYFGTCAGGQKTYGLPVVQPCDRVLGPSCLLLAGPRRCGSLDPMKTLRQYHWATAQRSLFPRYRGIVVASAHMKREFTANGAEPGCVHVNPLFTTHGATLKCASSDPSTVAFMGRMTGLKGGDLLIRAAARARSRLGRQVPLIMIGDGPLRGAWQDLAQHLDVPATFPGWQTGDARWQVLSRASLLAVPSVWPEPFGLVGLEAAGLGIPAIAFDVGGVREWLTPGVNGYLLPGNPPRAEELGDGIARAFSQSGELHSLRAGAIATASRMSLDVHLNKLEPILDRALAA